MDIVLRINEQTAGRDRIARLLQYGSRTCWYYGQNVTSTKYSTDILKSLEYTFSSFRKLLRFGRFVDSLYRALKTMKYPDVTVRVTLTLSKIANALFLLADHIIWLSRVGIFRVDLEKWNNIANKYWLMTIVMNLVRDVYEILKIFEREGKNILKRQTFIPKCNSVKRYYGWNCLKNHPDVIIDTVKNGCDLFIPLTALGFTNFSPGATGILGTISSAVALYTMIYPLYKMVPS